MATDDNVNGDGEEALAPADAAGLQEELSDKQSEAVLALVNEPTIARAAVLVGVHERTLRRWMEQGPFKRAHHAARRESFSHAIGLTQRYAPVAVSTLVKVMTDPQTPPGVKVIAAGMVLKVARDGIEVDELAERLEVLEKAAELKGAK